ncbi:MAG: NfeD family protein [Vampirovibrionia bacterium]
MNTLLDGWIEALVWFVVAGAFIVAEAFTPSFFLIWFGCGALLASLLALIGIGEPIQIIVFLVSSCSFLIFARPIVKNLFFKNQKPHLSNVYSIIGSKAVVLKSVDQLSGKVKVLHTGETWSAYTYEHFEPIKEKVQVIVEKVDGAKLVVIPKSAANNQEE